MKKKVLAGLAMGMILVNGLTAFASNLSATGTVVEIAQQEYEGQAVAGLIIGSDGEVIQGISLEDTSAWLKITDVTQASVELTEEAQVRIDDATVQLSEVVSVAEVITVGEVPEDFNAENAALLSLFDIDVSDDIKAILEANPGAKISVNAQIDCKATDKVLVLHNHTGNEWEVLNSTNNGDGSISIEIGENGFSPVAVYIEAGEEVTEDTVEDADDQDVDAEDTDEQEAEDVTTEAEASSSSFGFIIGAVIVAAIVVAVVLVKKRKSKEK